MGVAGYRDAAGHWLATPSQPLQAYDAPHETSNPPDGRRGGRVAGSGASVLFVRESKLIEVSAFSAQGPRHGQFTFRAPLVGFGVLHSVDRWTYVVHGFNSNRRVALA